MKTLRPSFTLVELILYVGLSVVVVTSMLNFVVTLSKTRGKEGSRIELQQQLRIGAERMAATVRHAQHIDVTSSTFGTASGVLKLTMSGSMNPTTFSLSGGSIYAREGASAGRVTAPTIRMEELRFINLTASGTFGTVQFFLRGRIVDPRYADVLELRSAVSLRQ